MILHGIVDISLVNISLVNISLVNILIRIVSRFVRLHLEGTKRYAGVQLGYRTSPYLTIGGSTQRILHLHRSYSWSMYTHI